MTLGYKKKWVLGVALLLFFSTFSLYAYGASCQQLLKKVYAARVFESLSPSFKLMVVDKQVTSESHDHEHFILVETVKPKGLLWRWLPWKRAAEWFHVSCLGSTERPPYQERYFFGPWDFPEEDQSFFVVSPGDSAKLLLLRNPLFFRKEIVRRSASLHKGVKFRYVSDQSERWHEIVHSDDGTRIFHVEGSNRVIILFHRTQLDWGQTRSKNSYSFMEGILSKTENGWKVTSKNFTRSF